MSHDEVRRFSQTLTYAYDDIRNHLLMARGKHSSVFSTSAISLGVILLSKGIISAAIHGEEKFKKLCSTRSIELGERLQDRVEHQCPKNRHYVMLLQVAVVGLRLDLLTLLQDIFWLLALLLMLIFRDNNRISHFIRISGVTNRGLEESFTIGLHDDIDYPNYPGEKWSGFPQRERCQQKEPHTHPKQSHR